VPPAFFADVHVRRAFTYAFDYGAFVVNVTHDAGLQPRGPIPLGLPGYNASIPLFPFDLARAATELNATPYWLSGFNLTLYYRAGNDYEEHGCRLLANGLEALHSQKGSPGAISVGVRSLTPAAYIGALHAGGLPSPCSRGRRGSRIPWTPSRRSFAEAARFQHGSDTATPRWTPSSTQRR